MSYLRFYRSILSRNFIARQNRHMQLCRLQLHKSHNKHSSFTNGVHTFWNCSHNFLFWALILILRFWFATRLTETKLLARMSWSESLSHANLEKYSTYCLLYVYLRQGRYVIVVVCMQAYVCLSVSNFAQSERICMTVSGKVGNGPMNKRFNFGGDPDHGSGSRHW